MKTISTEPHRRNTKAVVPSLGYKGAANVSEMSLLVWGEHCIECAAPACYATCDLYDRRPDGRCRRFLYGAQRNPAFQSFRGYGVEIQFQKWGKIEARGNTTMAPLHSILRLERALDAAFKVLNPIGQVLRRATGDNRWGYVSHAVHERVSRYLHRRNGRRATPDAFLLELYNPGNQAVTLQFMITPAVATNDGRTVSQIGRPPFRASVVAPFGYSRHEFDARLFQKVTDSGPFDVSLTPDSETQPHLIFLTADFVRFARSSTSTKADVKCVVWDLDNTIWDGVLLERPNVTIRQGVLDVLRYLDERGILLSIASKNDHDSAWQRLAELGIADLFLHPQINWTPKSQNVRRIAELLDIGIDSLAFVDDNPFELEEVASANPEVLCINASEMESITTHERIRGNTTSDARARRHFYQQAIVRAEEESSFGGDYIAFLASCDIKLQIGHYATDDLERVAELVQRTNQLNFSGRRYTRPELYTILDDAELHKFVLRCTDRYGSYGTIGFSIVRNTDDAVKVEDFMVSCRVQGKFLEQAFFSHLLQYHNERGARKLWVNFLPTAKNKPAQKILETLGFQGCAPEPGMVSSSKMECPFIIVECGADEPAARLDD